MSSKQLLKSIVISVLLMQDANQVIGLTIANKNPVFDESQLQQIVEFFNKKSNITEKWDGKRDRDHIDTDFSVRRLDCGGNNSESDDDEDYEDTEEEEVQ